MNKKYAINSAVRGNKLMVGFLVLVLSLLLPLFPLEAATVPVVDYQGQDKQLVFSEPNQDLFSSFKGMMPGDKVSQKIRFVNSSAVPVRYFLQVEAPDEASLSFLKNFRLKESNSADAKVIWEGKLDVAGPSANTELAFLQANEEYLMDLVLEMDIEADNSNQAQSATVIWNISAQEEPIPTPTITPSPTNKPSTTTTTTATTAKTTKKKSLPRTGERDNSMSLALALIVAASLIFIARKKLTSLGKEK